MGYSTVGALTFESAAYCARYVMKKMSGDRAAEHYKIIDPDTGEVYDLLPEYVTMSLKPAVGKDWYGQFSSDVYPDDFCVVRGIKMKPPKYYDRLHEAADSGGHEEIKRNRKAYAQTQKHNATPERLAVRKKVKLAAIANLKRNLE